MDLPHLTRALSTGTSASTRCGPSSAWPPQRPTRSWRRAPASARWPNSVRWPDRCVTTPEWLAARGSVPMDSARFNEACHTLSVQFPAEEFAEVRAAVEAQAKALPSDGETPLGPPPVRRLPRAVPVRGVGPVTPGRALEPVLRGLPCAADRPDRRERRPVRVGGRPGAWRASQSRDGEAVGLRRHLRHRSRRRQRPHHVRRSGAPEPDGRTAARDLASGSLLSLPRMYERHLHRAPSPACGGSGAARPTCRISHCCASTTMG